MKIVISLGYFGDIFKYTYESSKKIFTLWISI